MTRLGLILVLALAIRAYLVATASLVARDTATFVWYAQQLAEDPVEALRSHDQHPLYPALILGARHTVGRLLAADGVREWAVSAQLVSCVGGLAAIVALYGLAVQLFSRRIGLLAAFMMACLSEPCQLSADGLSDMPHLAVYLFAASALVAGVRRASMAGYAIAGGLSGVAFLIRPEGAAVAVVGLLSISLVRATAPFRRRLIGGVVCVAMSLVVAAPYMLTTGRVVRKKSLSELFHLALYHTPDQGRPTSSEVGNANSTSEFANPTAKAMGHPMSASGIGGSLLPVFAEIGEKYFRGGRVVFVLPMFLGGWWRDRRRADGVGRRLVVAMAIVHGGLLLALRTSFGYVSMRHALLLVVLTLPFSAAVLVAFIDTIVVKIGRKDRGSSGPARSRAWAAVMVFLFSCTAYWTFEPLHADRSFIRRAGEWIRRSGYPEETVVLTTRWRVVFYAGCQARYMPDSGSLADVATYIEKFEPDLLVVDAGHITSENRNPRFFEQLEAGLIRTGRIEPLHVESARPGELPSAVHIYRVIP